MSEVETLERKPTIGHNSESVGQMVTAEPAVVYRDDAVLPALLKEIEGEIAAATAGIDTKRGREAIASLAHSISRRKTPIVEAGKALTEDWRKKTATVNATKSTVEREFDALRDKARAPLDEWEATEKARQQRITDALSFFASVAKPPMGHTADDFDADIVSVERILIDEEFGDYRNGAEDAKAGALAALRDGRASYLRAEEERAELERLRAEAQERERQAQAAEEKRLQDAAEAERIAAAERRATEQAEARIRAEREAEEARAQAAQNAALDAERRKAREAEEALAAEQLRQRQAREAEERRAAAEAAALAKRQADVAHKGKIMGEAKAAIMTCGVDEGIAKQIVLSICAGTIPHVSIQF
jgi:colicin import membrane protein